MYKVIDDRTNEVLFQDKEVLWCVDFIQRNFHEESGNWKHIWIMGEQELNAFLEANLIEADKKVYEEIKHKLGWVIKHPIEATMRIIELEEKLKIK